MLTLEELTTAYPNQVWFEISSQAQDEAWPQDGEFSSDSAQWRAYLNQLCLNTLLPWLQDEYDQQPRIWPSQRTASNLWEWVNGTAIVLDRMRIVLLPTSTTDTDGFSVPQEWVDIPSWVANYYLAVQVNPDDGWLRVWGYTTHQQLKSNGVYDSCDRTYSLERSEVIDNLYILRVAQELCPDEIADVEPLPPLSAAQAETRLEQLSQKSSYSPRLNIPFEEWGALLENEQWRRQLYERRLQNSIQSSTPLVNLSNWVQKIEQGWQTFEEFMQQEASTSLALAFRYRGDQSVDGVPISTLIKQLEQSQDEKQRRFIIRRLGEVSQNNPDAVVALVNLLSQTQDEETRWTAAESLWTIAPNHPAGAIRKFRNLKPELQDWPVALMLAVLTKPDKQLAILLRVYPLESLTVVPPQLQLIVLDQANQIFLQSTANDNDNYIQLMLSGLPGEQFTVQVILGDALFVERFMI